VEAANTTHRPKKAIVFKLVWLRIGSPLLSGNLFRYGPRTRRFVLFNCSARSAPVSRETPRRLRSRGMDVNLTTPRPEAAKSPPRAAAPSSAGGAMVVPRRGPADRVATAGLQSAHLDWGGESGMPVKVTVPHDAHGHLRRDPGARRLATSMARRRPPIPHDQRDLIDAAADPLEPGDRAGEVVRRRPSPRNRTRTRSDRKPAIQGSGPGHSHRSHRRR